MSGAAVPGPFRPASPDGPARPVPVPAPPPARPAGPAPGSGSGHPAVDAVIAAIADANDLPPAEQVARYEAAYQTLQDILATIDQA